MLNATIETRDKLLLSRLELKDLVERNFAVVNVTAMLKDLTNRLLRLREIYFRSRTKTISL